MDYQQLLEYLDIEDGSQFEYFEAMADLVESEDYIDYEAMYGLFQKADTTVLCELINDYFEDILEGLPEDSGEIYSLLHQIKLALTGLASGMDGEDDLRKFTDEFYRFRNWYSHESEVMLMPEEGGRPEYNNVRDAITASRMEKLGGDKYRYDFENALGYHLDDYVISFSELAQAEDENDGTIIFSPEDGEPGDEEE